MTDPTLTFEIIEPPLKLWIHASMPPPRHEFVAILKFFIAHEVLSFVVVTE